MATYKDGNHPYEVNTSSSVRNLADKINSKISNAASMVMSGKVPAYISLTNESREVDMVDDGVSVFIDQNKDNSITAKNKKITTLAPQATVLIKKKAFSTLASSNELKWMDKTERLLLRATKALFAIKVQQLRAYEALTKFEDFFNENQQYSLNLLAQLLDEAKWLTIGSAETNDMVQATVSYTSFEGQATDWKLWYSSEPGKKNNIVTSPSAPFSSVIYQELGREVTPASLDPSGEALIDYNRPVMTNVKLETDENGMLKNEGSIGDITDGGFLEDFGAFVDYATDGQSYSGPLQDVLDLVKNQAFSLDSQLTTWIVDPDSVDNYLTGPGTGVIEITTFSSFSTSVDYGSSPSSANFTLENPYRLTTILDEDIEMAIEEALNGSIGLLSALAEGVIGPQDLSDAGSFPGNLTSSVLSSALEMAGLGDMDTTLNVDYIRDRLRTFYLGKSIVNPADAIHFYVRSNRAVQDFNQLENESVSSGGSVNRHPDYEIDEVILKAERELYTRKQLDLSTYKSIRELADNSFGMVHIFGGYVTDTSESFSGGKYTMGINCIDNMGWLAWSRFVIQPSLQDVKGVLEDPLTPYELKTDETGRIISSEGYDLLYENKYLLQTGSLSFDSGLFAGTNANETNIYQGQYSGPGSLYGSKIVQHPEGFVYRWKSGILTATADFSVVDPLGEKVKETSSVSQQYGLTVAENVLSNIDTANVISVLVCGQPYNMETFMQQSFEAHQLKGSGDFSSGTLDPLSSVIDTVTRQNNYYGNFKPYRMITMNSLSLQQMSSSLGIRDSANSKIGKLQARQIKVMAQVANLKKRGFDASSNLLIKSLESELGVIENLIKEEISIVKKSGAFPEAEEVGIEINLFGQNNSFPAFDNLAEVQDVSRATMLVGAQRRIEDVRLNRDRNLLIISDQYDKNTDIRPFLLRLNSGNWKLFDSGYTTVHEKCQAASSTLHLEFFCNTQGHLELRPPAWNRVPLSVLEETIRIKNETGRDIIPSFISNMFQTRTDALTLEIHKLNIKIVIVCLMLGRYPDRTIIPGMSISGRSALKFFGVSEETEGLFGFGESSGTLSINRSTIGSSVFGDLREQGGTTLGSGLNVSATVSEDNNLIGGDVETILGEFDPVFQQGQGALKDLLIASTGGGQVPAFSIANPENLNNIRSEFINEYGLDPAEGLGIGKDGFLRSNFIFNNTGESFDVGSFSNSVLGNGGLFSQLKNAISERDSIVTILNRNKEKQAELEEIESVISGTYGDTEDVVTAEGGGLGGWASGLTQSLADAAESLQSVERGVSAAIDIMSGSAEKGSIYDHLIEDDRRNLLGYGSGRRFIITDDQLVRMTFSESPPEFTRVDVVGDAPLNITSGLNSSLDGLYHWAGAADFDLWRQYGYKPKSINLPFASDSESQCRPYATLELQIQRTAINRGSVAVAGNEFYQPGDTVYIPAKGLLYYVRKVSHSFSFGTSFETTLDLVYGHPPGSYLPTPLDVIGQKMSKNILEHGMVTYRNTQADDYYRPLQPESAIVFSGSSFADIESLLSYQDNNARFTNMMIDVAGSITGNRYLLIRGFVKDENDYAQNASKINQNLALVRSLFENPLQIQQTSTQSPSLNDIFDLTGLSGTAEEAVPMRLPNNMSVSPLPGSKIIEQISYLSKEVGSNPAGEVKCLDKKLLGAYNFVEEELTERFGGASVKSEISGIFPKGGPRQRSWLNIRDNLADLNNIIEVGIITIPRSIS